jgi:hypothetical protein
MNTSIITETTTRRRQQALIQRKTVKVPSNILESFVKKLDSIGKPG